MTDSLIDQAVLDDLCDAMGDDFAAELVTTFLGDAPNMFADLRTAAADQDADGYRRAAHSIKSNAQVFGAKALADQARDMELGSLSDAAVQVPALEATFEQTAAALRSLLDE
ncbi:Hpt domain-containing protein [uncultured Sulfitobacter sp.]|uniref:Hpt domain-containing protein n=1 Tax=uncultured Sulfitobacter sp. TaxID=191468 RepID=UPI00263166FF|nr:Hpt domain-containing protein [uncultured Sulfitobacter sp.]